MNNTHPVLRVLTLCDFLSDYQDKALATIVDLPPVAHLIHCVTGLAEESGELLGIYKKVAFFGHELDRTKLAGELGDQLYYAVATIAALNVSLKELMSIEALHDLIQVTAEWRDEYVSSVGKDDIAKLMRPQVFMGMTCAADALNHTNFLALSWVNGDEPNEECAQRMAEALRAVLTIIGIVSSIAHDVLGTAIEDIANANLAKLAARYPAGKFDQAASANRNTEAEAAAIASAA
jgi:NTP pyrophosphatase (non-canonical NTP hydrolase)